MVNDVLRPGDPGTITRCPRCGAEMTGLSMDRPIIEKYPMVEMWEGGPLVEATWEMPEQVPGLATYTMEPCGCQFQGEFTLTTRRIQ